MAQIHTKNLSIILSEYNLLPLTSMRPSSPSLAVWSHHRHYTPCCCHWHVLPQFDCHLLGPSLVYHCSQRCTRPLHRSNTHSYFLCPSSTSSRHSRLDLQAPPYCYSNY